MCFYRVGQSGSKAKCYSRLVERQNTLELLQARDVAQQALAAQSRDPKEQFITKAPTEEEKRKHNLTHVPFAGWCSSCVKHRAKQGQHRRTGHACEGGPVISFDFAYTKASGIGPLAHPEEGDGAQAGVPEETGSLWLVAVESETGYLLGLPLRPKSQVNLIRLIAHELMAITHSCLDTRRWPTTRTTSQRPARYSSCW